MSLRIHDNTSAQQVQRSLTVGQHKVSTATERLATGYRINQSGDDAAGLQLSNNLNADIRGTRQAMQNVQDGLNFLQIADGVYGTVTEATHRIRELLVQAGSDTNGSGQRDAMATEIGQLVDEIERIYDTAYFGDRKVFDNATASYVIHVGAQSDDALDVYDSGNLNMPGFTVSGDMWYDVNQISGNLNSGDDARNGLDAVDTVLQALASRRVSLGKMMNNLEGIYQNLQVEHQNTAQAHSRLKDVDVASASLTLIQGQIQSNASTALLTQAAGQNAQIALGLMGA